ncbi:alkaline phosphatase-like protein [Thozetella sp. PMI_491]|nr:alkaline phosphatase-like protein [Thozetella sp. PMI_491]
MHGLAALLVGGSLLPALGVASFEANINYRSPSLREAHAGLGIDVPKVHRRSMKRDSIAYTPDQLNFTHGVASGDPYADSVILWTRVAPTMSSDTSNVTVEGTAPMYNTDREVYIQADANPICVEWKVFQPRRFCNGTFSSTSTRIVSTGTAYTTSDIDYTVKVEATGLKPFTQYTYQFNVCGSEKTSPMGRMKTSPATNDTVSELSFAVFSCANYPQGYFNAYGNAARKGNQDFVLHLGDFIYESSTGGPRAHNPRAILYSLPQYRTRHNQYRTDADLLGLMQNFTWITTWDDHEVADNTYRDGSSALYNTENSFLNISPKISVEQRKMNAVRSYYEWMPIRQVDLDDNLRIWRSFQMGTLLDLVILDTRQYDRSITDLGSLGSSFTEYIGLIKDEASRTLMGSHQEKWFYRQLSESAARGATWRMVGQQTVFSSINSWAGPFLDSWDGYTANRNRTLKHLYDNNIGNNIILAGDSHQNWVSDLVWLDEKEYNSESGEGAIGVELAGTAITSVGAGAYSPIDTVNSQAGQNLDLNSELQWQEGYYRGYFRVSLTPQEMKAQFFGTPTVVERVGWDLPLANFTMAAGANHLTRPVAGGSVEAGAVRGGQTHPTNLTLNTNTGEWNITGYSRMFLSQT